MEFLLILSVAAFMLGLSALSFAPRFGVTLCFLGVVGLIFYLLISQSQKAEQWTEKETEIEQILTDSYPGPIEKMEQFRRYRVGPSQVCYFYMVEYDPLAIKESSCDTILMEGSK